MSCSTQALFCAVLISLPPEASWHPDNVNFSLPQPPALQQCDLLHRLLAFPSSQSELHYQAEHALYVCVSCVHSVQGGLLCFLTHSGAGSDMEAPVSGIYIQEQVLLCLEQAC